MMISMLKFTLLCILLIEIPEGLPLLLLILAPICGGALLVGVVVIVLLLRRRKKNQPTSAPPPVMTAPPPIVPAQPVTPSPQITVQCPNCGATLSTRAKFCNRCGTPLTAPPAYPQQNPGFYSAPGVMAAQNPSPAATSPAAPIGAPAGAYAPQSEPVVGIIHGLAQVKGLSARQYNLVVTPNRLVFARLTNQMLKDAMAQSKQQAKAEGRGLLGQWGSMFSANAKLCERYYSMPIDMILRETPDNFVIYPQQVKRVRIQVANANDESNNYDRLVIQAGSRMVFQLKGTNARETKQILRQVLGNLVK
jgi:hypothetical protein